MYRNQGGQSLVEFVICVSILVGLGVGFGRVLMCEWRRVHCKHQVFEAVHAYLMPGYCSHRGMKHQVQIVDNGKLVRGHRICGQGLNSIREEVILPHLESAQW